eukprot:TRINITY_DN2260_c0_g3_i6.p1 TRINITY_DN2260_c0_g3~~TRINITY_DN2260_c0_g3_i6.p1  ORF type:complete len:409 (-),score=71.30 TRINITY_DN2260_c0_g3_i6:69-1295(-)
MCHHFVFGIRLRRILVVINVVFLKFYIWLKRIHLGSVEVEQLWRSKLWFSKPVIDLCMWFWIQEYILLCQIIPIQRILFDMTRGRLLRAQEARVESRRVKEYESSQIAKYYGEQRNLDAASANLLKDDLRRREREARERQTEEDMIENLYYQHTTKQLQHQKAQETERIANEVLRREQEKDKYTKEIQKIHNTSEDLRALAEQIRCARVNKERKMQREERQIIQQREQEYDDAFDQMLDEQRQQALEVERQYELERRQQNIQARKILEEQMQERLDAVKDAQKLHEHERNMVDGVVRAIEDEDRQEYELKRQKQRETMSYISDFLEEQQRLREEQREAEREEERKILEYMELRRQREAEEEDRQAQKKEAADRLYDRLKQEKEEEMRKQAEEEYLINMMREEIGRAHV